MNHSEVAIDLLCGGIACFYVASGIGYRYETCGAMVGSMGMPEECKTLYDAERIVERLKASD